MRHPSNPSLREALFSVAVVLALLALALSGKSHEPRSPDLQFAEAFK